MGVKRALLVGIDVYPDPRNNLNSCVADTQRFRGLLQDAYGFAAEDVTLLHNSAATLANVRTGLSTLLAGISDGDQVVYFESSHGYRYVKGSTMNEVLCLYDQFLEDTELVQISQQVPPGTFTCVADACHSGGLEKLFFAPGGLTAARAKVWQPPAAQALADLSLIAQATSYKSFAHASTSDTGAVAKQFSVAALGGAPPPAAKAGDGQSELNGVLFAACLADETAAAGSPATDGLSAFTWALGKELELGGGAIGVEALSGRVAARLSGINVRQTPTAEAPMAHGDWLDETFIAYGVGQTSPGGAGDATSASPGSTPSPAASDPFDVFLTELGVGPA